MRGELGDKKGKLTDFYATKGVSPDEVADAVLRAISRQTLIVPVPRRQVLVPYLLHRLSPSLLQPIARVIDGYVKRM